MLAKCLIWTEFGGFCNFEKSVEIFSIPSCIKGPVLLNLHIGNAKGYTNTAFRLNCVHWDGLPGRGFNLPDSISAE